MMNGSFAGDDQLNPPFPQQREGNYTLDKRSGQYQPLNRAPNSKISPGITSNIASVVKALLAGYQRKYKGAGGSPIVNQSPQAVNSLGQQVATFGVPIGIRNTGDQYGAMFSPPPGQY